MSRVLLQCLLKNPETFLQEQKDIFVFPWQSRFPVKLIYCIAFGSASTACFLPKPTAFVLFSNQIHRTDK